MPVAVACRVLGLTTAGYYKWLKDPVSQRDWDDAHLIDVLYDIHEDDATLGYRFLTDELVDEHGITVGENRVHRLCRIAGIAASHHKKRSKPGSTGPAPHDDLLAVVDEHGVIRHEFVADGPNKVWLWDISEHPTREGKLYICAIKDVFSNKIVGYSIDSR
ncbi:IS3 family transposase, partial [Nocardioides fonticola]|uniref:IS3 family transposase n=1 Tax=Nocardioides fonticola TaxID=450363 RepID=UPI0031DC5283